MYKIKRLFERIIRLFQYIPIILESEDWDYYHLISLIEFKLKRMRNCLDEYYTDGQGKKIEVRKQIDKTLDAINKYNNEFELFPMIDPEELFNVEMFWKKNEDRNTSSTCYKFVGGKEVPQGSEFYLYQSKYIKTQYKWQQACWNRIFNTIRNNGQYWWD